MTKGAEGIRRCPPNYCNNAEAACVVAGPGEFQCTCPRDLHIVQPGEPCIYDSSPAVTGAPITTTTMDAVAITTDGGCGSCAGRHKKIERGGQRLEVRGMLEPVQGLGWPAPRSTRHHLGNLGVPKRVLGERGGVRLPQHPRWRRPCGCSCKCGCDCGCGWGCGCGVGCGCEYWVQIRGGGGIDVCV